MGRHSASKGQPVDGFVVYELETDLPTAANAALGGMRFGTRVQCNDSGVVRTLQNVAGTPTFVEDGDWSGLIGPITIATVSGSLTLSGFSALSLTTGAGQSAPISVQPGTGAAATAIAVGGVGGTLTERGGFGGAASAAQVAGAGGATIVAGGAGGAGSAAQVAGAGATASLLGGQAGANGGAGGANGGDAIVDAGSASGGGTSGTVSIGVTNAAAIVVGKTAVAPSFPGGLTIAAGKAITGGAGALTVDTTGALNLGPTAATSVAIGKAGIVATIAADALLSGLVRIPVTNSAVSGTSVILNAVRGKFVMSNAGATFTLTNSTIAGDDTMVIMVVDTADANATTIKHITVTAGQAVLLLSAAPAADTTIRFIVINP